MNASIYCTVSFKKGGFPAMGCLDAVHLRMDDGNKHRGLFWIGTSFVELLLSRAGRRVEGSRRRLEESPLERPITTRKEGPCCS